MFIRGFAARYCFLIRVYLCESAAMSYAKRTFTSALLAR